MAFCINCGSQMEDDAAFCPNCGAQTPNAAYPPPTGPAAIPVGVPIEAMDNPKKKKDKSAFLGKDHTDEFDKQDISDNKAYALFAFLFGILGLIIALLAGNHSPYIRFQVRQVVKLIITQFIFLLALCICCVFVFIPGIGLFIALFLIWAISMLDLVIFVAGIVFICMGKARELPLVCWFPFMR